MGDEFKYDVFLSHSEADKPTVLDLAERLDGDGLLVWLDEWCIRPGDLVGLMVEGGLEKSRTLVLCMSSNAFASDWVSMERHTLLFRDPTNSRRRFIPLLLENCSVPAILAQFQYVDWRDKAEESYWILLYKCMPSAARGSGKESSGARRVARPL
jgi:hypothetical protein